MEETCINNVIGCSVVIINKEDKTFLLTKRQDVPVWVFVGGTKEKNETPKQCIIRETKEEVGLNIKNPTLFCKVSLSKGRSKYFYFANYYGETLAVDKKEVADYKWFSLKNPPSYTSYYNKNILNALQKYNKSKKLVIFENKVSVKNELFLIFKHNPFYFIHVLAKYLLNRLTKKTFTLK